MTLPVVWLPEAQAELMEALEHYGAIRPELGDGSPVPSWKLRKRLLSRRYALP